MRQHDGVSAAREQKYHESVSTDAEQPGEPRREQPNRCGRCGYPLAWDGVAETVRCPECGATHTKRRLTRKRHGPRPSREFNPKYFWFAFLASPTLAFVSALGSVRVVGWMGSAIGVFWYLSVPLGAFCYLWFYGGYAPTCYPDEDWRRNKVIGLVLGIGAFIGASLLGWTLGPR